MRKLHINKNVLHFFFDTTGAKKKFTKRNAVCRAARPDLATFSKKVGENFKARKPTQNLFKFFGGADPFCKKGSVPPKTFPDRAFSCPLL